MSEDGQIVWEDPPKRTPSSAGVWIERLAPLMEHPGRWARVAHHVNSKSSYEACQRLRGKEVRMPAGDWEFTSRKLPDESGAVYARYIGPEPSP